MNLRISQYLLLCEDDRHAMLVCSCLKLCGVGERDRKVINASEAVPGGNIGWVLDQFSTQLKICRQRHQARANTLLIVVADADNLSIQKREDDLRLREAFTDDDPLVILTPRRHVETWVCAAIGRPVTEEEDCKRHSMGKAEIRQAAKQIYHWARHELPGDSTCVPSLRAALPRWRQIG